MTTRTLLCRLEKAECDSLAYHIGQQRARGRTRVFDQARLETRESLFFRTVRKTVRSSNAFERTSWYSKVNKTGTYENTRTCKQ